MQRSPGRRDHERSTHPVGRPGPTAEGDGLQLGVDILVDEAVPLAQGVQRAQQGHRLLRQGAAVSGRK